MKNNFLRLENCINFKKNNQFQMIVTDIKNKFLKLIYNS